MVPWENVGQVNLAHTLSEMGRSMESRLRWSNIKMLCPNMETIKPDRLEWIILMSLFLVYAKIVSWIQNLKATSYKNWMPPPVKLDFLSILLLIASVLFYKAMAWQYQTHYSSHVQASEATVLTKYTQIYSPPLPPCQRYQYKNLQF